MRVIEQEARILFPSTDEEAIRQLKLIEWAGRNCYQSQDKVTDDSYRKFIESLIKREHFSPLEFGDMVVELTTGRDVLAEITRHRLCSFAVQSQRYVVDDKTGDISFIRPEFYDLNGNEKIQHLSSRWTQSMKKAEQDYKELRELGSRPEDARKVLPNSTACKIVMKANLREWLTVIFKLRCSKAAYPEMRKAMSLILPAAKEKYPVLFQNCEVDEIKCPYL